MKQLPDNYQEFIKAQLLTIDEMIPHANSEVDSLKHHRDALNYLVKGRPSNAIDCLFDAHKKYEEIEIQECDPHLLQAKGNCILDAIIISHVYEKKYDLIDFNPSGELAFYYLWLSFELSHLKLYSSLASLSELFLFFVEGNMIMMAGGIQTLPPTHFPEFFSIVCQQLRITYFSTDVMSLGSRERRYFTPVKNLDLSQGEKDLFQIYKSEIESTYKRLDEMVIYIGDKYQNLMPNLKGIDREKMLSAINEPISRDNQITYHQLFETMIRNMKKYSGGIELFKNIPLKKDDVLQNENFYGLFTLIYTDMYNKENRKSDDEISDKLFGIAKERSSYGNYGFADLIAQEALSFAEIAGDKTLKLEIERFSEENVAQLLEKETETNIDDFSDQFFDFLENSDPDKME